MATIQVVVDDKLLERLDCELNGAARGRSEFIRQALNAELKRREKARLDEQDRLAYLDPPTDEERREMEAWQRLGLEAWKDIPWDGPSS